MSNTLAGFGLDSVPLVSARLTWNQCPSTSAGSRGKRLGGESVRDCRWGKPSPSHSDRLEAIMKITNVNSFVGGGMIAICLVAL